MEEQWSPIKEYEGVYMISNKGGVKRIYKKHPNGKHLNPIVDRDGYLRVSLSKNNIKRSYLVHRLVAEAFIPNINNFPVINHKDENKQNNQVDNLEWCTVKYNTQYNNGIEKRASKRRIPIKAIKDGQILYFKSIAEASEILQVNHANVIGCLKGVYGRRTCKGYEFEYLKGW